jgi:hypothetical protein
MTGQVSVERQRAELAFEMAEFGARQRELRFRREHLDATDHEVAEFMRHWWAERPQAPHGDAAGTPLPLDRLQ